MLTILERFKEPSSYAGLASILGLIGINIGPELMGYISTGLASIAGVIAFFVKEKSN